MSESQRAAAVGTALHKAILWVSQSALWNVEQCPAGKWESGPAAVFGREVHAAIERLVRAGSWGTVSQEVGAMLVEFFDTFRLPDEFDILSVEGDNLPPEFQSEKLYNDESEPRPNFRVLLAPGIGISGAWDLVSIGEGELIIWDWKTGHVADETKHLLQGAFYTTAAATIWPGYERYIFRPVYLRMPRVDWSIEFAGHAIENSRSLLLSRIARMQAEVSSGREKLNKNCGTCVNRDNCGTYGTAVTEEPEQLASEGQAEPPSFADVALHMERVACVKKACEAEEKRWKPVMQKALDAGPQVVGAQEYYLGKEVNVAGRTQEVRGYSFRPIKKRLAQVTAPVPVAQLCSTPGGELLPTTAPTIQEVTAHAVSTTAPGGDDSGHRNTNPLPAPSPTAREDLPFMGIPNDRRCSVCSAVLCLERKTETWNCPTHGPQGILPPSQRLAALKRKELNRNEPKEVIPMSPPVVAPVTAGESGVEKAPEHEVSAIAQQCIRGDVAECQTADTAHQSVAGGLDLPAADPSQAGSGDDDEDDGELPSPPTPPARKTSSALTDAQAIKLYRRMYGDDALYGVDQDAVIRDMQTVARLDYEAGAKHLAEQGYASAIDGGRTQTSLEADARQLKRYCEEALQQEAPAPTDLNARELVKAATILRTSVPLTAKALRERFDAVSDEVEAEAVQAAMKRVTGVGEALPSNLPHSDLASVIVLLEETAKLSKGRRRTTHADRMEAAQQRNGDEKPGQDCPTCGSWDIQQDPKREQPCPDSNVGPLVRCEDCGGWCKPKTERLTELAEAALAVAANSSPQGAATSPDPGPSGCAFDGCEFDHAEGHAEEDHRTRQRAPRGFKRGKAGAWLKLQKDPQGRSGQDAEPAPDGPAE